MRLTMELASNRKANMRSIRRSAFAVTLASCAVLGGMAFAQTSDSPHPRSTAMPSRASQGQEAPRSTQSATPPAAAADAADATFAKKAAAGGIAEAKLGQLAQEKSSNSAVKDFGKRMENDHLKAGGQLKDAASRNHIALPAEMSSGDQATYDHLSKLSGPSSTRVYAQLMVTAHEEDIEEFKNESSTGKNQDIKMFASNTLPTLQDHLRQAREMEKIISSKETGKNSQ